MDVITEMVFYKTEELYKVLYISSLDDTELSMYKSFSIITSVLNVLLYCISSLPQIAKFVNPDDTELSMYKSLV